MVGHCIEDQLKHQQRRPAHQVGKYSDVGVHLLTPKVEEGVCVQCAFAIDGFNGHPSRFEIDLEEHHLDIAEGIA